MSCRRAFETDLAAFLLDPRASEWDDFRAHYPTCPECAAEVAAWTALGAQLASDHPSPQALLEWVDAPGSLPAADRAAMRAHLARCRPCADEVRALGRFEKAWATTRAAPVVSSTSLPTSPGPARRSAIRRWSRVLWNPAVPYAALLALFLLPAIRARVGADRTAAVVGTAAPVASAPSPQAVRVLTARRADFDDATVTERSAAKRAAAPAPNAPASPPVVVPAAPQPEPLEATGQSVQLDDPPGAELPDLAGRSDAEREERRAEVHAPAPEAADSAAGAASETALRARSDPARSLSALGVPADDEPRTMVLSSLTPAGTRKLSIPLPARARSEGAIDVRLRDASGDRELREAVRIPPDATEISLDVPAAWLRAGRYEVELHSASGLLSRTGLTAR